MVQAYRKSRKCGCGRWYRPTGSPESVGVEDNAGLQEVQKVWVWKMVQAYRKPRKGGCGRWCRPAGSTETLGVEDEEQEKVVCKVTGYCVFARICKLFGH